MNTYTFQIYHGENRHSNVEIRAEHILKALTKLEELALEKYDKFSLLNPIGGQIIRIQKVE